MFVLIVQIDQMVPMNQHFHEKNVSCKKLSKMTQMCEESVKLSDS